MLPLESMLDDEFEELLGTTAAAESLALQDAFEFPSDGAFLGRRKHPPMTFLGARINPLFRCPHEELRLPRLHYTTSKDNFKGGRSRGSRAA
jgi:hypothetical protein